MTYDDDAGVASGLPGMKKELREVYEGLVQVGATSPSAGHSLQRLSKELHEPKKRLDKELHELEGKGIVGHLQSKGHEEVWYAKR